MRDPHKESRVLRHLRIADGYLKSGNKLTKAVFRNLIEREGDLLGITEETKEKCKNKDGEIIEYLLEGYRINYINKAWTKLRDRLKEEAKKKGDIASILIIEDKHYRGYSQSFSYVVKGYSILSHIEDNKTKRRSELEIDLDKRLQTINLIDFDIKDVTSEFSKLIFGSDYPEIEKKAIALLNKKFVFELEQIMNLEEASESSQMAILTRYRNLLNTRDNILDSNYAYCLYRYAEFIKKNQASIYNTINPDSVIDWTHEICYSLERAVQITEHDPTQIINNTRYILAYANYINCKNLYSDNRLLNLYNKLLSNLLQISNSLFKADCLMTCADYFATRNEHLIAWDALSQANEVLLEMSNHDNNVLARLVINHDMMAKVAEAVGYSNLIVLCKYETAIRYSKNLSYADLKAQSLDLNSTYSRYESRLLELNMIEQANSTYIQHLNFLIKSYTEINYNDRRHYYMSSCFFEWSWFLHLNDCLEKYFCEYNKMLSRIAELGVLYFADDFIEELELLQLIWNYSYNSSQYYESQIVYADTLFKLAEKQSYIFSYHGDFTHIIEANFKKALLIYEKYSSTEMRCLISAVDTKFQIAELNSFSSNRDPDKVINEYESLLSFLDEVGYDTPFFKLQYLKVLNSYIRYLISQSCNSNIKSLISEARGAYINLLPYIRIDFKEWDKYKIINYLFSSNTTCHLSENDIDYFYSLAIPDNNLCYFQNSCLYQFTQIYELLIWYYKNAYLKTQIDDNQAADLLTQVFYYIFNDELTKDISDYNFFELLKHCVEAIPNEAEQIKLRQFLRNFLIKEVQLTEYLPYLPQNIITKKLESIKWKEDSSDIIYDLADLALIYNDLGLRRKEKWAYLKILEIINKYNSTRENVEKNSDTEDELDAYINLYRIYLQSCRYKIALNYLDKIISIYENLRKENKSYHKVVKQYKIEKLELEDKLFEE